VTSDKGTILQSKKHKLLVLAAPNHVAGSNKV
jgi:hypothetical protein